MIPVNSAKDQNIALFGLGGSGMVSAHALVAGGARLNAFDDNPKQTAKAAAEGIPVADLREFDFSDVDALVLAPGVPLTHPKPHWSVELARAGNTPVIGDIELFDRERRALAPDSDFVAITGTNGKSTTTALISHIFSHADRKVEMGGNIGRAVLSLAPPADDVIHVIECSSYQIDLAPGLAPKIGLLLNLAPDHLDRHGTMENYINIKTRLVAAASHCVIGIDDEWSAKIADEIQSTGKQIWRISSRHPLDEGVYASNDSLNFCENGTRNSVASLAGLKSLRGPHNRQNAAAAWIICHLCGLDQHEIQTGFKTFPGLAHRMEIVGNIGRVSFVNDSKATNADAAAMALASFNNIHWIAGGLAKEGGIEGLREFFPRIAKAYLVGEAAPEFASALGSEVVYEISGTIDAALARAAKDAAGNGEDDPIVLLSPACASFDQFQNFEIRGNAFRDAVKSMDKFVPYGEMV